MEKLPKFVIEDGNIVMMKVLFHKEIVNDTTKVKGGGWFSYNRETNTFVFFGESEDFKKYDLEELIKAVEAGRIYTNKYHIRSIADRHNFAYTATNGSIIPIKVLTTPKEEI